jgi:hypothetical protein
MIMLTTLIYVGGAVKKFPDHFDISGLMHREFVPPGQSATVQVVQRKQLDKWQAGTVVSAPNHTSLVVSSPNHRTLRISLRITFGCLSSENWCKGTRFATMEVIKSNAMADVRKNPEEAFPRSFQ